MVVLAEGRDGDLVAGSPAFTEQRFDDGNEFLRDAFSSPFRHDIKVAHFSRPAELDPEFQRHRRNANGRSRLFGAVVV